MSCGSVLWVGIFVRVNKIEKYIDFMNFKYSILLLKLIINLNSNEMIDKYGWWIINLECSWISWIFIDYLSVKNNKWKTKMFEIFALYLKYTCSLALMVNE